MFIYDAGFVADYIEIRQLSARYNQLSDAANGPEYAKLYTEDGIWESGPADGRVRFQGPEQLAYVCSTLGRGVAHVTADPYIEINGDHATQTSRLLIFTINPDENTNKFGSTGTYVDELLRTPEGWRFKSRMAYMDLNMKLEIAMPRSA